MTIVDRTCTEIPGDGGGRARESVSRPLSEYRSASAYVLLGDAGAGKSTCFEQECGLIGESAVLIPARDFVTFDVNDHPEWCRRTLFIDGLDEIRAGDGDIRTALDRVRGQLDRMGKPAFRLSCRGADWLGRNDRARLEAVALEGRLKVLRLDPLTPEDAEEIVAEGQVGGAADFLAEARTRGLEGFVQNPQNLTLLMSAVAGGHWPESRRELFEVACRQLVLERNPEHRDADRERPAEELLFEAAGRACALLLLSGKTGVDLSSAASDNGTVYQPLARFDPPPTGTSPGDARALARLQRLALSSRLFTAAKADPPTGQRFEPVHRHIAEFLAGRYLGQRVDQGLPAARIIALITAGDGGVVTAHRGLSAWLAAHSEPARPKLIERDPIGVGLYGDIAGFSPREKRSLLQALIREGRRLHDIGHRNAATFTPLATPALEAQLCEKLTARPLSDDDQLSAEFVLRILRHGASMPSLVEPALAIVYDTEWWPRVACAALDAFVRQCSDTDMRIAALKKLLRDIQEGAVADPDNQLAATVLDELYPDSIAPSEIWTHLDRCQPTRLIGRHWKFWTRTLEETTPDDGFAALLDGLASGRPDLSLVLRPGLDDGRALAERLLARALHVHGTELSPRRLCDWLTAPARSYTEFFELQQSEEAWEATSRVRSWLEANPDAYKAALWEGVADDGDERDLVQKLLLAPYRLRRAKPPLDFGRWCLERARETARDQPDLARWLFAEAHTRLEQGEEALSQGLLDEAMRARPTLRPKPPDPEAAGAPRKAARKRGVAAKATIERREHREQQWLDAVRAQAPALRENRGNPAILWDLANEWFQRFDRQQVPLAEWLREKFGPESDLASAIHEGLCGVTDRDDLPDPDEVLRLQGESRMHYLSVPFLASLHAQDAADSRFVNTLNERQKRQASVFYYSVPNTSGSHPDWYRRLLERDLELVADVLVAIARIELRHGRENVTGLWDLAHDAGHAGLARIVSLPLLRGFPVRCHVRQLHNLTRLLWTALQHADHDALLGVIEKKLAGKSMTVNQRVHWLAAGVIAAPDAYAERLAEFIDGKESRARQLAKFLWSEHPALFRPAELPAHALEVLIQQSGAAFGAYEIVDGPANAQHESVLWRLPELIDCLAASPEPEAGAALHRLADDETLHRWRHHLRLARDRQTIIARDSSYRRPGLEAVRATLDNLAPANAADLAALTLDRLDELAGSIRHTNTNDWSQYWNQNGHAMPTTPKPENACRDALLSGLVRRLPEGVDAQPEGQYAANRRADIRLSCSGFHVPIEIKKQSHPALWRAARDQLVAKYAQDPATGGYGIFVTLWFGEPEKTPLDETGTRPASPEELRQRLEACIARQLAPEQARKIAVRVIDVSKP